MEVGSKGYVERMLTMLSPSKMLEWFRRRLSNEKYDKYKEVLRNKDSYVRGELFLKKTYLAEIEANSRVHQADLLSGKSVDVYGCKMTKEELENEIESTKRSINELCKSDKFKTICSANESISSFTALTSRELHMAEHLLCQKKAKYEDVLKDELKETEARLSQEKRMLSCANQISVNSLKKAGVADDLAEEIKESLIFKCDHYVKLSAVQKEELKSFSGVNADFKYFQEDKVRAIGREDDNDVEYTESPSRLKAALSNLGETVTFIASLAIVVGISVTVGVLIGHYGPDLYEQYFNNSPELPETCGMPESPQIAAWNKLSSPIGEHVNSSMEECIKNKFL